MIDILAMPVVQAALEEHRQKLDENLGQRVAHINNSLGTLLPGEVANEITGIAHAARELGALDTVCALHGVTEAVATRMR